MSAPQAPEVSTIPSVPEALATSPNPVHKLSAAMLEGGLTMLRGFYDTIRKYNNTQSQSEDLLKTSDLPQVKAYREAAHRKSESDQRANAEYNEAIKPLQEKRDATLKQNNEALTETFLNPALKALNLDAGITAEDLGTALKGAEQTTDMLKNQAAQVAKQGIDMSTFKLPELKATKGPGEIGFTPKFSAVNISTVNIEDGTVLTSEDITDQTKMRNTDIIKRLRTKRQVFLQRFLAPFNGNEDVWRDANPGFTHTFPFSFSNVTKDEHGNFTTGIRTDVTVTKASKTKALTPTGEEVEVDIVDPTDVDDDNDLPVNDEVEAQF